MALTRLNVNVEAHKSSSPEIYGFHTNSNGQLIITTTNAGEDSISHSTFTSFKEYFKGSSGITFSISNGQLIATI